MSRRSLQKMNGSFMSTLNSLQLKNVGVYWAHDLFKYILGLYITGFNTFFNVTFKSSRIWEITRNINSLLNVFQSIYQEEWFEIQMGTTRESPFDNNRDVLCSGPLGYNLPHWRINWFLLEQFKKIMSLSRERNYWVYEIG